MADYKGIIRFISSEESRWAIVKQYPNTPTDAGDVTAEVARVISEKAPDANEEFDLSTSYHVTITIDSEGPTEVDIQGSTPAQTTVDEIISAINAAFTGTPAYRLGSGIDTRIGVRGSDASDSGVVTIAAGSSTDALSIVFADAILTDSGVTGVDAYNASADGYRVVKADFSSYDRGDQIEYNYNSASNFNTGHDITII